MISMAARGVITVFLTSSILLLSRQVNSLIQQRHWRQGATNTIYEIQYKVPLESELEGNWKVSLQFSKPVTMITTWNNGIEHVSPSGKEWVLNRRWPRTFTNQFDLSFQATVEEPLHSDIGIIACLTANQNQEINCETLPEPLLNVDISCVSTSSTLSSSSVVIENRWGQGTTFYRIKVTTALEIPLRGDWWLSLQFSKPVSTITTWNNRIESSSESGHNWILKNPDWSTLFCREFELSFEASVTQSTVSDLEISACLTGRQQQRPECGGTSSTTPVPTAAPSSTDSSSVATTQPSITPTTRTTITPTTRTTITPTTRTTITPTTRTTITPTTVTPTTVTPTTRTTVTQTTRTTITPTTSPQHSTYDYNDALNKSILFYEAQRSGKLPANNRILWRGDSALNDTGPLGENLTGGWYDAGDHVKFNFPQAASVTVLAWGILSFWDGYVRAGELANVLDSIKWPLDYLIKCHVAPNKFYAQVGNGHLDHAYWGSPEDMTMERPAYYISEPNKPGSDLAGEVAAAMAASSLVFRKYGEEYGDTEYAEYADTLLDHAKTLFDFADTYRGKYSDSVPEAFDFYRSWSGYEDELAWSALWLYKATEDQNYLAKVSNFNPWSANNLFSWDDKSAGVTLMLYTLDTPQKTQAKAAFERFLDNWATGKNGIEITLKGLSFGLPWASLRYASNAAFLALVAAKEGIQVQDGINFARKQIHYALGDTGHSFVCGFGVDPPEKPHHRGSSCEMGEPCQLSDPEENPNILYGALVGGPDQNDVWLDDRSDHVRNEVAIDYNAGFQSSVAGLIELTT